ncbi:MAG: hypothetical protein JNM93_12055 [Bacteriovoracaceae bacterium]|nr:hypothetical protein [Bacteriovoracaceae bacterium]
MRIVLFQSGTQNTKDFLAKIPKEAKSQSISTKEELFKDIEKNGRELIVVFDLDQMPDDHAKIVEVILSTYTEVKRFYLTANKTAKELRAHQFSSEGGDAYIKIPIQSATLVRILEQFGFTGMTIEPEISATESKVLEEHGISPDQTLGNFNLGTKIQNAFNQAMGEGGLVDTKNDSSDDNSESLVLDEASAGYEVAIDLGASDTQESIEITPQAEQGNEISLDSGAGLELSLDSGPEAPTIADAKTDPAAGESGGIELNLDNSIELNLENGEAASAPSAELDLAATTEDATQESFIADPLASNETSVIGGESLDLSEHAKTQLREIDNYLNAAETAEAQKSQPIDVGDVSINFNTDNSDAIEPADEIGDMLASAEIQGDNSLSGAEIHNEEVAVAPVDSITEEAIFNSEPEEIVQAATHHEPQVRSHRHETEEMSALLETLESLRAEKNRLMVRLREVESERIDKQYDAIRLELESKDSEIQIVKKHYEAQLSDMKKILSAVEQKAEVANSKQRLLQKEVEKLNQKVKEDYRIVYGREKELEGQLELVKADAQIQIRNRDAKILELKRKIDLLEFDMENIVVHEEKQVQSKEELEGKLNNVMKTLRTAIGLLEENTNTNIDDLKKNLDI